VRTKKSIGCDIQPLDMPVPAISNWLAWTPQSASINQGKNTRRDVNEDVQQTPDTYVQPLLPAVLELSHQNMKEVD
jgi:hypothetical protein